MNRSTLVTVGKVTVLAVSAVVCVVGVWYIAKRGTFRGSSSCVFDWPWRFPSLDESRDRLKAPNAVPESSSQPCKDMHNAAIAAACFDSDAAEDDTTAKANKEICSWLIGDKKVTGTFTEASNKLDDETTKTAVQSIVNGVTLGAVTVSVLTDSCKGVKYGADNKFDYCCDAMPTMVGAGWGK